MRYFLDRSVSIRRLRRKDANRSAFSATGTSYDCSFQDTQPDRVQYYNGQIGKTYDVYIDGSSSDIDAGDQVVIRNNRYSVKAKEVIDFGGTPYIALTVVAND